MPVEPKRSVIRVSNDETSTWYHASRSGDELVLREIPKYGEDPWKHEDRKLAAEIEGEQYSLQDAAEKTGLPVTGFSIDEPEAWTLLTRRLDRLGTNRRQVVPATPLRRLYQGLRALDALARRELACQIHLALASSFVEAPDRLADLCNRSFEAFLGYDPKRLKYLDKPRSRLKVTDDSPLRSTDAFVATVQAMQTPIQVDNAAELSFRYVERELSPLRTTNGVLETGEPASKSGTGGADLLLQNYQDQVPIIGEIKISRDATLLLALVQALTYALEFSTPRQIGRLARSFVEFKDLVAPSRVDVYLISAMSPQDEPHPTIRKFVEQLAEKLCSCGNVCFLRRIAYLEADLTKDGRLFFRKEFAFESQA